MKKRMLSVTLVALLLVLSAVAAHALTISSQPVFSLKPGDALSFSFSPAAGQTFTDASLDLNVTDLKNKQINIGGDKFTQTPSLELLLFNASAKVYEKLFTKSDLTLGHNIFSLNNYLPALNQANSGSAIKFAFLMDGGKKLGINAPTLNGTVAPEPASVALVCAGLVALPFARRFRNRLQRT